MSRRTLSNSSSSHSLDGGGSLSRSQERHTISNSSIGGGQGNQLKFQPTSQTMNVKKNPFDKTSHQVMADQIFSYLSSYNYDSCITVRQLMSPSTKTFLQVYLFLMRHYDPNFPENINLEDIPTIMKMLGYPTTISKNILSSIGAPHTTSHILQILNWLCSLLM